MVEGRKEAPRSLCAPWYKEGGGRGGLNLLLAFNGVCKLYLGDGEGEKGGRNCKGGGVELWMRVVKIGERVGRRRGDKDGKKKRGGRKRHSWRLPHKLPKKAPLRVSVRV